MSNCQSVIESSASQPLRLCLCPVKEDRLNLPFLYTLLLVTSCHCLFLLGFFVFCFFGLQPATLSNKLQADTLIHFTLTFVFAQVPDVFCATSFSQLFSALRSFTSYIEICRCSWFRSRSYNSSACRNMLRKMYVFGSENFTCRSWCVQGRPKALHVQFSCFLLGKDGGRSWSDSKVSRFCRFRFRIEHRWSHHVDHSVETSGKTLCKRCRSLNCAATSTHLFAENLAGCSSHALAGAIQSRKNRCCSRFSRSQGWQWIWRFSIAFPLSSNTFRCSKCICRAYCI